MPQAVWKPIMIKEEVNMADEKQAKKVSGGEEIPMDTEELQKQPADRTLRRTISAPMDGSNDSVFSPVSFHSSFQRNSLNGGLVETASLSSSPEPGPGGGTTQQRKRMRPKSTSSCRSSSISDDDQLSPHLKGQRPRTYSDSLNVDCSSTCPSPVSFFVVCFDKLLDFFHRHC